MDINGTQQLKGSPQQVWSALHNSAMLQSCIPGAQRITWQGDNALTVEAIVSVGPVSRTGEATVQVVEQQQPNHIKLSAKSNHVTATATVDLAPDGTGTLLTYNAHADLGGPFAAVAALAKPFVDSQLKKVFSCLDSKIG